MRQSANNVKEQRFPPWLRPALFVLAAGLAVTLWWIGYDRQTQGGVQTFTQTLKPKEFFKWDSAIERLTLPQDGAPFEVCLTGELVCIKSDLLEKLLAVMLGDDGVSSEHGILSPQPLPDPRSMIMR